MFEAHEAPGFDFRFLHQKSLLVPGLAGLKLRAVRNVILCHFGSQSLKAPQKFWKLGFGSTSWDSSLRPCVKAFCKASSMAKPVLVVPGLGHP